WYNDAYDDVTKAKDILASEKPDKKKADKLFKRAIERASEAVKLDATYYEALNLQGFAWRKLGDYPKSLDAYSACLRIQPDYAPAREYYGQALLESGDRDGAEAQLAWLKRLKADDLAKQLETAIAAAPVTDKDKATKTKPDANGTTGTSGSGRGQNRRRQPAPSKRHHARGGTGARGGRVAGRASTDQRPRPRLAPLARGEPYEITPALQGAAVGAAAVPTERMLARGERAILDPRHQASRQIVHREQD